MIEETGRVVAVDHQHVWIETIRKSGCSSCSVRSGCGQGLLSRIRDNSRNHIHLCTELDLQVGDEVVLGMPEQAFIRSSFLAYGLPLLALIAAVVLADRLFYLPEPWVIVAAIIGLAGGFLLVRWLSHLGDRLGDFQPVIIRTNISITIDWSDR